MYHFIILSYFKRLRKSQHNSLQNIRLNEQVENTVIEIMICFVMYLAFSYSFSFTVIQRNKGPLNGAPLVSCVRGVALLNGVEEEGRVSAVDP